MKKLFIIILCLSCLNLTVFVSAQYSQELQEAYKWAYDNWVTTMDSIEKANMNWKITREEMAKMISNYAKNILWIVPDSTKPCLF